MIRWRTDVGAPDIAAIRALVDATGVFSPGEVDIAAELVEERVRRGSASGYDFVIAEADGAVAGYTCYGPTPGTDRRYDLYWIVVAPDHQGKGLARELYAHTRAAIAEQGGVRIYVETSSTPPYAAARALYQKLGLTLLARIPDFYRDGDDKLILAGE